MEKRQVITYQMGNGAIALCSVHDIGKHHGEEDHPTLSAMRTAPLGPVQHGRHFEACAACRVEAMAAMTPAQRDALNEPWLEVADRLAAEAESQ